MRNGLLGLGIWLFFIFLAKAAYCDTLTLKESEEGNEVEILEEKRDSFIIRVPKSEIKKIRRKRPSDVKLWKEKRILWEDTEDYVVMYLPKERIVLPEGYEGDEYDSAKILIEEGLSSAATEGRPSGMFSGAKGRVTGQVVKYGEGISGVKLKIVNVSYQENLVSRLFGPEASKPEDLVLETETDEFGRFEFKTVPIGEYDIYWRLPGSNAWYRQLSEKPSITVRPGEIIEYPDIKIK